MEQNIMKNLTALDIGMYVIIGLAFIGVLTHAAGFAQATTSIGNVLTAESSILSGSSTAK
jgi:hypothetical protein